MGYGFKYSPKIYIALHYLDEVSSGKGRMEYSNGMLSYGP